MDELAKTRRLLGEAALEARVDASRKPAVIEMRRRFASALGLMSAAVDDDPRFRKNPELAAEFHRRVSEMRAKIAIFQAKWPAVLLDCNNPDFDRSAEALRASNREFTDWLQAALRA